MKDTLEMDILDLLVRKAQSIKEEYGFVPGFFGDPKEVIDRLTERKREKREQQGTLDLWLKLAPRYMEEMISTFFNKESIETMIKDSFYGHNNINLNEIENRMRLSKEKIGDSETLLSFLKSAVELYHGKLIPSKESTEENKIFEVELPDEIQKDINFIIDTKYKVTTNNKIAAIHKNIDGLSLKNPLLSGLIEKVKNEAFIEDHQFYGRTAAFSSNLVSDVSAIYNFKIRYVINTEPKSITEEMVMLGIEIFSGNVIEESKIVQITKGKTDNHGKPEVLLKKHFQKALEFPDLDNEIEKIKTEKLESLILERKGLI